jgi:hypothetical protein
MYSFLPIEVGNSWFQNVALFWIRIFSFGLFPGVCSLIANVSEHPVCSIFIGEWVLHTTQKKTYVFQNTAKVWNQENMYSMFKDKLQSCSPNQFG